MQLNPNSTQLVHDSSPHLPSNTGISSGAGRGKRGNKNKAAALHSGGAGSGSSGGGGSGRGSSHTGSAVGTSGIAPAIGESRKSWHRVKKLVVGNAFRELNFRLGSVWTVTEHIDPTGQNRPYRVYRYTVPESEHIPDHIRKVLLRDMNLRYVRSCIFPTRSRPRSLYSKFCP